MMDVDWLDNDDELAAALAVHEQQETEESGSGTRMSPPGVADDACEGFDMSAGHNWIYPTNMPLRSYQQTIVQSALYKNTLVVLPTGLGKTFIAAVVMYNFYRWYPQGKIVFMAPTRPLVAQQINASQKIMPFVAADTVQLTGQLARPKRAHLWATKRVFFVTPQVVHSDMLEAEGGATFPFASVKLIVVDEAHRAKGRYAYTQVADSMMAHNRNFRMLALSATPGRNMEDVATVCQNLFISNLQVRWDTSIDVQPYIHRRTIRTIVVSIKDRIKEPREQLLQIIEPYLRQLIEADIIKGNKGSISKNSLLYEQKSFLDRSIQGRHPEHNIIMGNFSMCISLYHSLELMERHGLRVFVNNFDADEDGREKFVLARDRQLRDLVEQVRQELGANPLNYTTSAMTNGEVPPLPADLDFGHAKYEKLRQVLLQHFESHSDSRAIVFCEYRESVMLIQRLLLQHRPLLRPRCFVGQGATVGASYALTQKQQLQIMADFRSGTSNVLVATSIGEEGIDVGEVELIVCFDICSSNPTRFVQRIGRTGRKKNGEVVMLVTEGREQQILKDVLAHKDQINRNILNSSAVQLSLYQHNPRMVPPQFSPKCEEKHMEAAPEEKPKPTAKKKEPKKRKEPPVKSDSLRKYFKETPPSESQHGILQGMPAYTMSEASQAMLKEQVSRRSITLKNFFVETQATTSSSSSQEEVQRLRKLNRLLQSNKPIISESPDLISHLRDEHLPQPLKLYMLQSNPYFVKDIHTKMQLQSQLNIAENRLNSRQQRTRNNYKLILDICNGPEKMEELMKADESVGEITLRDLEDPLDARRERRFMATCDKIFAGLEEQGLNSDNFELKQQLLEKLEMRNLEATVNEQLGGVETSWEEEEIEDPIEEQCDSMYLSQRTELEPFEPIHHSSTPIRVKPLSKLMFEPPPKEDATNLEDNLSRLNSLMSNSILNSESFGRPSPDPPPITESVIYPTSQGGGPVKSEPCPELENVESTPEDLELEPIPEEEDLTSQKKLDKCKEELVSLLEDMDIFLEPMEEEMALTSQQQKSDSNNQKTESTCLENQEKVKVEDTLDIFDEPMEEEVALMSQQKNSDGNDQKTESNVNQNQEKVKEEDLFLEDLDGFSEPMAEEVELMSQQGKNGIKGHPEDLKPKKEICNNDLDLNLEDFDDFLEPMAEEVALMSQKKEKNIVESLPKPLELNSPPKRELVSPTIESKENNPHSAPCGSPNIFDCDSLSPWKPQGKTLAAKLAAKASSKPPCIPSTSKNCQSPENRKPTNPLGQEKSPSIFDLYLKRMRGQGRLAKAAASLHRMTSTNTPTTLKNVHEEDSPVIRRPSKRKIIISSDEEDEKPMSQVPSTQADCDFDDVQQIPDTQMLDTPSPPLHARKKRRYFNSFIADEAEKSGSDHDEEAETTIGTYLKDSVIVSSDEDDHNDTNMHAIYLQAARSPIQRPGAFKMPAPRAYHNDSQIFSQPVEDDTSQYLAGSFIVDDDTSTTERGLDVSECPLEKAERILKERRRQRRLGILPPDPPPNKRRRVQTLSTSSDEDDVIFVK
ncbi:DEAD-box ATP-dependent DNA helicase Fancm [Drosophila bipectinata]|uniref:DEAD-box ATP-dependent DNA helicase Fancm n=1 Tax=Drosophila bipectinata TaxID=42026 RepID=UPI001C8A5D6B|nr:Fanconi anemia group M protein [Drosophila bipectinata]